jgi:hypothetical protein
VVWKANRAKSKIARKLLNNPGVHGDDLDAIVQTLTAQLYAAPDPKSRLRILFCDWGFALPMATAILTVLWPDDFTIYDTSVCEQLGGFHNLYYRADFDRVWQGYEAFIARARSEAPPGLSLRDQDRYLFGRSSATQLHSDIEHIFGLSIDKDCP